VASHLGGSLTHGKDHLTRYAPEPFAPGWAEGGQPRTLHFDDRRGAARSLRDHRPADPAAVLRSCHGPEKAKAKLRLDSYDALQRGSENGPVVQAGDSASSRLVEVTALRKRTTRTCRHWVNRSPAPTTSLSFVGDRRGASSDRESERTQGAGRDRAPAPGAFAMNLPSLSGIPFRRPGAFQAGRICPQQGRAVGWQVGNAVSARS